MNEAVVIIGMALVTFGIRYPVLAWFGRISIPPLIRRGLEYVPLAVLSAIIVPAVLMPDPGQLFLSFSNDFLVASSVAVLISWRTKNLLLTILIGMGAMWGWRWIVELGLLISLP